MLYWLERRSIDPIKTTVITSNLSLEDFKKKEERLTSRILENALVLVAK
jgi:hypothetical protein